MVANRHNNLMAWLEFTFTHQCFQVSVVDMTDSISEELYQGGVIPDGDRTMNTAALKHELQHSMTTMKDDLMKQFEEYFIGMEGDEDNSDGDDDQNTKELQVPTSLENYLADGSGVSPKTKQSAFAELAADILYCRENGATSR